MQLKHILLGAMLLTSLQLFSKSFLVILDHDSNKRIVLKKGQTMEYQKAGDNHIFKGMIKSIASDKLIIGKDEVKLEDLRVVTTKSYSRGVRAVSAGVVAFGALSFTNYLFRFGRNIFISIGRPLLFLGAVTHLHTRKSTYVRSEDVSFQILEKSRR